MAVAGAFMQAGDIKAQGQQVLSEFVMNFAGNALALIFADTFLVSGEFA